MSTTVILAAGRATRLDGACKLLVDAGGVPVVERHRRVIGGAPTWAVIRPQDARNVAAVAPWLWLVEHDAADGPAGALRAFLDAVTVPGPVTVLFADTLLSALPPYGGDWAGVAPAPWRTWDYRTPAGEWTRGVPRVEVCAGVYRFSDRALLEGVLGSLLEATPGSDVAMADVLAAYGRTRRVQAVPVTGWQDAGDHAALARLRPADLP